MQQCTQQPHVKEKGLTYSAGVNEPNVARS